MGLFSVHILFSPKQIKKRIEIEGVCLLYDSSSYAFFCGEKRDNPFFFATPSQLIINIPAELSPSYIYFRPKGGLHKISIKIKNRANVFFIYQPPFSVIFHITVLLWFEHLFFLLYLYILLRI
jgi:hypothetical protein